MIISIIIMIISESPHRRCLLPGFWATRLLWPSWNKPSLVGGVIYIIIFLVGSLRRCVRCVPVFSRGGVIPGGAETFPQRLRSAAAACQR